MKFTLKGIGVPMLSLTLAALSLAQQSKPVTVTVGTTAPPLDVKKWVKGTPVTELGHGKVNVVEFWATWCGPCKVSIPHLTELAHKYQGKATFTGVSVWENPQAKDESFLEKVDSFVKDMGDKMDYNVAADGLKGTMASSWMSAAGQNGIPTAFVVDQQGKVAWIGHPMAGLDEVVQKVIDGKFDIKAEAAREAEENAKAQKANAASQKLNQDAAAFLKAARAGKMDVALVELDKLIAKDPEFAPQLSLTKFSILAQTNEPAAYTFGKQAAKGILKDNGQALNSIAWQIVDDASKLKHPDFAAAVVIAKQAAEASHMSDPMILDTYAYALFKNGDKSAAVAIEEKAVALGEKKGSEVDSATLKEIKDRLDSMKAKSK